MESQKESLFMKFSPVESHKDSYFTLDITDECQFELYIIQVINDESQSCISSKLSLMNAS